MGYFIKLCSASDYNASHFLLNSTYIRFRILMVLQVLRSIDGKQPFCLPSNFRSFDTCLSNSFWLLLLLECSAGLPYFLVVYKTHCIASSWRLFLQLMLKNFSWKILNCYCYTVSHWRRQVLKCISPTKIQ